MFSSIPIARPTAQAIQKEVNRAKSAAASAGTTWSGSDVGSSCVIEAARTPRPPATIVVSSVFASASWSGDSPISIAPTSFSEAARVARPNRRQPEEQREDERRADTIAGRMNRSTGTFEPNTLTVPRGSTGGCGFVWIPNPSDTAAWRDEQHPERRGELRERRRRPQGPEGDELDQRSDGEHDEQRDHERRRRRNVPPVDAGLQRPVRSSRRASPPRPSRG